jgi:nitroimidazol reductase NimA-like FMN-containing flavoprotein (pyridoxamine 5'-phosphate oxidase superfamily)
LFREIKLEERAIPKANAIEILKIGSYGVLSTVGDDGYPYGVPVNYTYADNCIYFHCGHGGHKLENIQFTEKVSFCVVTNSQVLASKFDTDFESVIAFGRAETVTDDSEKKGVLLSFIDKYSKDYPDAGNNYMKKYWDETSVLKIKIEHLTGKARK